MAIRWFDTPLTFITELPTHRNLTVSAYTEGLVYLFRTDSSALTFTRIVAQWQNSMRPLSRRPTRAFFSRWGMFSVFCPPATEDTRADLALTRTARLFVPQTNSSTC
ncbi:hypothetical protein JBE38_05425 [Pseudomonas sp. ICBG1301]|uniref:hypothetical protein n=1 Tax=Pseudomonas sp. ICBG1301 TaxID=2795987 RepID=UPI0019668770|nr:hypothetical protein [Pseudomonas sp. ICBG1301]MBM9485346.1 hypothetical protein [Pseudomonas sp. ICBG1301]